MLMDSTTGADPLLEQRRLAEGVILRGCGSALPGVGSVPPFEAQIREEFLHGRLPVQYFNIRGGAFELGPFHGIEHMRRSGCGLREHTAGTELHRCIGPERAVYGSPKPACTRPPT